MPMSVAAVLPLNKVSQPGEIFPMKRELLCTERSRSKWVSQGRVNVAYFHSCDALSYCETLL